jgi:hypothetical protein
VIGDDYEEKRSPSSRVHQLFMASWCLPTVELSASQLQPRYVAHGHLEKRTTFPKAAGTSGVYKRRVVLYRITSSAVLIETERKALPHT